MTSTRLHRTVPVLAAATCAGLLVPAAEAQEPDWHLPPPPVLSNVSMQRSTFAVVEHGGTISASTHATVGRGSRIRFTLSGRARPTASISRISEGRIQGTGRDACVKLTAGNRKAKKCRLSTPLNEVKGRPQEAGPGSIDITGYLPGRVLKPGSYTAEVWARDYDAQATNQVVLPFTIVSAR